MKLLKNKHTSAHGLEVYMAIEDSFANAITTEMYSGFPEFMTETDSLPESIQGVLIIVAGLRNGIKFSQKIRDQINAENHHLIVQGIFISDSDNSNHLSSEPISSLSQLLDTYMISGEKAAPDDNSTFMKNITGFVHQMIILALGSSVEWNRPIIKPVIGVDFADIQTIYKRNSEFRFFQESFSYKEMDEQACKKMTDAMLKKPISQVDNLKSVKSGTILIEADEYFSLLHVESIADLIEASMSEDADFILQFVTRSDFNKEVSISLSLVGGTE